MKFNEEAILHYSKMVWSSILGLEAEKSQGPITPSAENLTGCIQITGAWSGLVSLNCPRELLQEAAGILFSKTREQVTPADVLEALYELTNMVGGNIKSILPGPSQISLPRVADNRHPSPSEETEIAGEVTLRCRGQNFQIRLLRKPETVNLGGSGK